MYIRNACVLWESDSYDYGEHWTEAHPTDIRNPGSKMVMYKIGNRFVLIDNIWNDRPHRYTLAMWIGIGDPVCWIKKTRLASFLCRKERSFYETVSQISYPHGFADDNEKMLYLALDGVRKFYMIKIPYKDILE